MASHQPWNILTSHMNRRNDYTYIRLYGVTSALEHTNIPHASHQPWNILTSHMNRRNDYTYIRPYGVTSTFEHTNIPHEQKERLYLYKSIWRHNNLEHTNIPHEQKERLYLYVHMASHQPSNILTSHMNRKNDYN